MMLRTSDARIVDIIVAVRKIGIMNGRGKSLPPRRIKSNEWKAHETSKTAELTRVMSLV
jgi:hypothetical protein